MPCRQIRGGHYKVLSDEDLHRVHQATLEVLADVGVRVEYRPALQLMADNGCVVDMQRQLVKVPEHVLRKALSTAPSQFVLHGRTEEFDVKVDCDSIYTIGGSSALFVLDLDGQRRPATLRDLEDLTRLQDSLTNLHIMHGIVNPQDIPQEGFDRRLFSAVMRNTRRNYYSQAIGGQGVRDQVEMASVILGGTDRLREKRIFTMVECMISPLVQPPLRVEELMESARHGIPLYIEVDAQPGATTPITLAGTLVEQSANVLCGITLAQMVAPGTPCIYSIASGIMDMSTGNYSGGAPETTLLHAATAQVAHSYHLPFQGGTGIEATVSDAQAGYERALQVLGCALAGVNFIHLSIGMMEQMLLAGYEQCVIDDEILGAAFHIAAGMEVNDETLAVSLLREVGPGGNFLSTDHTVRHLREERWFPRITNRDKWDPWQSRGAKDMRMRANEEASRILKEHDPHSLPPEVEREIERMAVAAQKKPL